MHSRDFRRLNCCCDKFLFNCRCVWLVATLPAVENVLKATNVATDKKTKKRIGSRRRRHGNTQSLPAAAQPLQQAVQLHIVVSLAHTRPAIGGVNLTLVTSSFPLRV